MNKQMIQRRFEEIQNEMHALTQSFPWEEPDAYLSFLAQTLEYATYTTRLLALTAGHFPLSRTSFAARFIQHAAEEKGHDKLLLNDAMALGVDLSSVPVLPEGEAFHKSLYFWIYQGRPTVIMGWVLFLEGLAVRSGPDIHARAERAYGRRPTSFLRVHTEEDPDHVEKALALLDEFSEAELREVAHGLELYFGLYAAMLAAIKARASSGGVNRAA